MRRWFIIRHLRYYWLAWRVHRHAQQWARAGIGTGWPNESDLAVLRAIWEGRQ